jgi:hypothetical protein
MIRGNILNRAMLGLGLMLVVITSGCSGEDSKAPKLAPAKGSVKYNAKVIAGATVMFVPTEGTQAMGTTDKEGNFVLTTSGRPGATIGKCKVVISKATEAVGMSPASMKPEDMVKMATASKNMPVAKSEIPAKYSKLETTTEVADVAADGKANVFEFNLVD